MNKKNGNILKIFDWYEFSSYNQIPLKNSFLAVLVHYIQQEEEIVFAGIFGSYGNSEKNPDETSDVDIAIFIKDFDKRKFSRLTFKLKRKVEQKVSHSYDLDICSLNSEIDHSDNKSGTKDDEFRSTVLEQIIVIKGNKRDLPESTTPPYFPHQVNRFSR
jgi:predicted nucleotidyltransferase